MTYVNHGSITAVGILFPTLAVLCVSVRIWVWRKYASGTFVDDILIIPAAIFVIGAGIALVVGAQSGYVGGHTPAQPTEDVFQKVRMHQIQMEQLEYGFWPVNNFSIGFTKLSILFLYRRIFQGRTRRTAFDVINWFLIILTICWTLAFSLTELFACGAHANYAWGTLYELRYDCVNTFQVFAVSSSINFIVDLAILIEPIAVIFTLQMSTSRRLQASVVFLLGAFAVGAGLTEMVIRIIVFDFDLSEPSKPLLGTHGYDDMGVVSILLFWSYMEMGVGFVVACLLPCRKFFDNLGQQIKSASSLSLVTRRNGSASKGSDAPRKSSETSASPKDSKEPSKSTDIELERIMSEV